MSRARDIADKFSPAVAADVTEIAAGSPTEIAATSDDLSMTGNEIGDVSFVQETNRLFLWTGTGWYNIALVNTAPSITSVTDSNSGTTPFALATDGTPTVITLTAEDPEGIPLTWSYSVTSGSLGSTATVSQADNVFTITPSTNAADDGTFEITFTASDGVNIATDVNLFSLTFFPSPVIGRWSVSGYPGTGASLPNIGTANSADGVIQSGASYNSSNDWFDFDGTSDAYIQYPNETGQYPYDDFTMYAFVNMNSYGNSSEWDNQLENTLLHLNGANSSVSSRRGGITSRIVNGYPNFGFGDANSVYSELAATSQMSLNTWYFLAFTRDASTGDMKIFINDTSTAQASGAGSTNSVKHDNFDYENVNGITFGRYLISIFPYTYGFKGKAAEWGVFNRVLTQAELQTIKNVHSTRLGIS